MCGEKSKVDFMRSVNFAENKINFEKIFFMNKILWGAKVNLPLLTSIP